LTHSLPLIILDEADRIPEGRPVDEVELFGDHALVGVELAVHQRDELRGKRPVVVCQFAPAGVAGQFRQLPQAGINIETVDVEVVVFERGQIAAAAGQV
jgi:hypothetical protein